MWFSVLQTFFNSGYLSLKKKRKEKKRKAMVNFIHMSLLLYILKKWYIICFFYQVKTKMGRSHKLMKGAAIRTRKLARDMLLYWKRVDKEMVSFSLSFMKLF